MYRSPCIIYTPLSHSDAVMFSGANPFLPITTYRFVTCKTETCSHTVNALEFQVYSVITKIFTRP